MLQIVLPKSPEYDYVRSILNQDGVDISKAEKGVLLELIPLPLQSLHAIEIGEKLGLARTTVYSYLTKLFDKKILAKVKKGNGIGRPLTSYKLCTKVEEHEQSD